MSSDLLCVCILLIGVVLVDAEQSSFASNSYALGAGKQAVADCGERRCGQKRMTNELSCDRWERSTSFLPPFVLLDSVTVERMELPAVSALLHARMVVEPEERFRQHRGTQIYKYVLVNIPTKLACE